MSFSHQLDLRAGLTADRERLRASVDALEPGGSTALRDAAYAGLALRGASEARTLLLLFSDGVDTSSLLDERRVIEVARRSDVIVYAVGVRGLSWSFSAGNSRPMRTASGPATDNRFLNSLATETGGRLIYAETTAMSGTHSPGCCRNSTAATCSATRPQVCRPVDGTASMCGSRTGKEPCLRAGGYFAN